MAKIRFFLVALAVALTLGAASAEAWNSNYFQSPTGNIRCRYFQNSSGRQLACITLNNGRLVGVTPTGQSFETFDSRGYLFPRGPTLNYGEFWRVRGLYRCDARRKGMACRSLRSGHGFLINKTGYRLF